MTFTVAFAIGFSIASIPGPTIILIATETLKSGARAGLVAMMAPVLLDALIMVPLAWLLQTALSSELARTLGVIGGCFLVWLGLKSIRAGQSSLSFAGKSQTVNRDASPISSFIKVTITHLTSPYPYLYWGTVGGLYVRQGFARGGFWEGVVFPLGFWVGVLTFTAMVIYVIGRGRKLVSPRVEPLLHVLSGVLLIGAGLFLVIEVWRDWP